MFSYPKALRTAALLTCLLPASTMASNIPDYNTVQNIQLTSADVSYAHPQNKPNHAAAKKLLRTLGLSDDLDSLTPTTGGYGEVYLAQNAVVKVSLPDTKHTSPYDESLRLLVLKKDIGENPFPGLRVSFVWPNAIYCPTASTNWWERPDLGTFPYHLQVTKRVRPVKEMMDVVEDALIRNVSAVQADIFALGHALGKMQASTIRHKWGDRYVSDAHMDLNPKNILPTGLPSMGQQFAISLIDLADVRRSTDDNAPELPTDVLYHLIRTWDYVRASASYQVLPRDQKLLNVQTYVMNFFTGYFSAFSGDMRKALKPIYTTTLALQRFKSDSKYAYAGPQAHYGESYDAWVIPAIAMAFQYHEVPSVVAHKLPYQMLMTFNSTGYRQLYPTACKDAALFKMDPDTFAKFHYVTWGRDAGYFLPDRPVTTPAGFNSPAYLEMYPHVKNEADQYKMDPNNYAMLHYMLYGQALKYVFLTHPITVPEGFNEQAYRWMYPDVDASAPAFKVTDLNVFARVHYSLFGNKPWGKEKSRLVVTRPWVLPWDWNTDRYLAKWPHLKAEAERFGIELKMYAQAQYIQFGRQCAQAYK